MSRLSTRAIVETLWTLRQDILKKNPNVKPKFTEKEFNDMNLIEGEIFVLENWPFRYKHTLYSQNNLPAEKIYLLEMLSPIAHSCSWNWTPQHKEFVLAFAENLPSGCANMNALFLAWYRSNIAGMTGSLDKKTLAVFKQTLCIAFEAGFKTAQKLRCKQTCENCEERMEHAFGFKTTCHYLSGRKYFVDLPKDFGCNFWKQKTNEPR